MTNDRSRSAGTDATPSAIAAPGASLGTRERLVLRGIVQEYVESGTPVGSRTIARRFPESLSSATIRNIMSDLEEAGLIAQPHTSAGRVPTELGYRFYVDSLMDPAEVPRPERDRIARGLRRAGEVSEILESASQLLSSLTHLAGVVLVPELRRSRLRRIDFVRVSPTRALVILISTAGVVYQLVIGLDAEGEPPDQPDLDRCGRLLSEKFQDKTLDEIRAELVRMMAEERALYDRLLERSVALGRRVFEGDGGAAGADLFVGGASNLLAATEHAPVERVQALLRALEEKESLLKVLDRCRSAEGVLVRIGSETREPEMADCAVVASPYELADGTRGSLGVIGPARMEYERMVGLVGEIAERLSRVLRTGSGERSGGKG